MAYNKGNASEKERKISLTADSWSSAVHRGYMVVTGHWIDDNWNLYSVSLDLRRFYAPHTADASRAMLRDVIEDRDLTNVQNRLERIAQQTWWLL